MQGDRGQELVMAVERETFQAPSHLGSTFTENVVRLHVGNFRSAILHLFTERHEFMRGSQSVTDVQYVQADSLRVLVHGREVNLPDLIHRRLLQFFRERPDLQSTNFDCYEFAAFLNAIKDRMSRYEILEHWDVKKAKHMKPGDTVLLTRGGIGSVMEHAAIHLGSNLYLSEAGYDGCLFVCSLEQLQSAYQAPRVHKASPNKFVR